MDMAADKCTENAFNNYILFYKLSLNNTIYEINLINKYPVLGLIIIYWQSPC